MQVDPIKPKLKPPGTKRLRLKCDLLLSTSAFKFNLRRYIKKAAVADAAEAGEDALYDAPGFYKAMGDSWYGGGDRSGGGGRIPVQYEQAVGSGAPAPILVWFRQDLRLRDNPALHAASRRGQGLTLVHCSARREHIL